MFQNFFSTLRQRKIRNLMARIKNDSHLYKPLKYVDILTDYGFKLLFGNKELLMAFLNALFEDSGKVVNQGH